MIRVLLRNKVVDSSLKGELWTDTEGGCQFIRQTDDGLAEPSWKGVVTELEYRGADLVDCGVEFVHHLVDPSPHQIKIGEPRCPLQGHTDGEQALHHPVMKVTPYALSVIEHTDRPDTVMESGVVDRNARSQSKGFSKRFVLVREVLRTRLVCEIQVAEDLTFGPDGYSEKGLHRRMVRWEPITVFMGTQLVQSKRHRIGDQEPEDASTPWAGSDCRLFPRAQPGGEELLETGPALVEHSEGPVVGVDQRPGLCDQMAQKHGELDVGLHHEHGVHEPTQLLGVAHPVVRHGRHRTWASCRKSAREQAVNARGGWRWHNGGMTIRVFLLDDHELVREGIRLLLESDDEIEVVGEAATAAEAMDRIPLAKPDVAILDVRLEGGSGIEVCRDARSMRPELICLMLTSFADDEAIFASVMAGAAGYVLKQIKARDLIDDVHRVAAGESLMDPRIVARVVERIANPPKADPEIQALTPQERRILDLIAEGQTNRQIAESMFLAEHTVKNYITGLLRKLKMSSRTEAAIYATKLNAAKGKPDTSTR